MASLSGGARLLRQRGLVAGLGIALTAIIFAVVAWTIVDSRHSAWHQAERRASNIARGIERDVVGHTFSVIDLVLRAAVDGMATPHLAELDATVRDSILFGSTIAAKGLDGVSITDANGNILYYAGPARNHPSNVADREYFQRLRQDPGKGLIVSRPIVSRSVGLRSIVLARRISHADGSFAGAAVAVLRVNYFRSLFGTLEIGHHGSVVLAMTDGDVFASQPSQAENLGRDVFGGELITHLGKSSSGSFEATTVDDGVRRLWSYRQLANAPLVLSVGLSLSDIYAGWIIRTASLVGVLFILLGLGLGLIWALRGELQRRERAERQHREARARLDAIFDNSADSMIVAQVVPEGGFVYEAANRSWEAVSGRSAETAVGVDPRVCLPTEIIAPILAAWEECVRENRPVRYSFTANHRADPTDWEALVAPVPDEQGAIRRLIAVARDVTSRNKLETSLRHAQRMEAVGQLTAGLAHDFNNLLQSILGALEMLQTQPGLDARTLKYAAVAERAGERGATLVHRLLAFSRKQSLTPVLLSPEQVFADLAPLLASALGNQVEVDTEIDDSVGKIFADGAQLDDCLLNLAMNARDAMPEGGALRLRAANAGPQAALAAGLPAMDFVCFGVTDEGTGMSPDTMARALEPFFTTKLVGKGTGLGLSMVQGFARQSGGDVRIESAPGRGTTVSIWLPRSKEPDAVPVQLVDRVRGGTDRGRGHVLVVDDEADVRQMLLLFLTEAGYGATAVDSGEAALLLLQAGETCDLLVTDQSMPGMKGTALIGEVLLLRPNLPTMLITGYDRVSGLDEMRGRVTVMRKPFRCETFLQQIQALLGATPEPAVAETANVISLRDWAAAGSA